jgi:orotate phosphoribosyltransferase
MSPEIFSQSLASSIAKSLLECGAVRLSLEQPFTWASGWRSPIYCDNRLTLAYPEVRDQILAGFLEIIRSKEQAFEAIAGVATAGIPWAALIADHLKLPMLYVRSAPKGHGMGNLIEGKITPSQKVLVIEDLISTGGSSLKAVDALRAAGMEPISMLAIFTYGFPVATQAFLDATIEVQILSNYEALITEANQLSLIPESAEASLKAWREAPEKW